MIAYKYTFKRLRDGVSNRAITKEQKKISKIRERSGRIDLYYHGYYFQVL